MCTGWLRWLGLLVVAAPACGGGSVVGTMFTPTTPVAEVCNLLTLSDVQTFLPGANEPVTSTPDDTADFWSRGCSWQGDGDGTAAELTIFGALTSNGNAVLDADVAAYSNSGTPVSGVGDQAVYVVNNQGLDQYLDAKQGGVLVSLGAYNLAAEVPEATLEPLVVKVLGEL